MSGTEHDLFATAMLGDQLRAQEQAATREISTIDPDGLLKASQAYLVEQFVDKYNVNVPILEEDDIAVSDTECDFDVARDSFNPRRGGMRLRGTAVTYHIPYHRDQIVFDCIPNPFDFGAKPRAVVEPNELSITYTVQSVNAEYLKQRFAADLARIKDVLEMLEREAAPFNHRLPTLIEQQLNARRAQVLNG